MDCVSALGLDIGSTTVKAVVLDGTGVRFSAYRRHNADARGALRELLREIAEGFPHTRFRCAVTGSAGLGVAEVMCVEFVQEVIAATEAIERFNPEADVVIELGGEDAKITFLHPVVEQRMNGTCAGGTGAFIDQMATLLHTDAAGLDALAAEHRHLYPIASRCGVFAKSDLQPLLNQGAAHSDLAASVFAAVATQTIAGLACGHPIRGNVVFLGGPLHFLPQLRAAYERALADQVQSFTTPYNAHLYVAIGAALLAQSRASHSAPVTGSAALTPVPHPHPGPDSAPARDGVRPDDLVARLRERTLIPLNSARLRPLFADDAERAAFDGRHHATTIARGDLAAARGPVFLGIDAGSTTVKAVLLTLAGEIVFDHYQGSNDPVHVALGILRRVRTELPDDAYLARACVTGYGEGLVRAALRLDDGEIETMAHYRAAERIAPGVTSVIDIGGQDMKYLRIRNGAVDSIAVNEACSSGCGSFLQTFAASMNTDVQAFADSACASAAPVDLGTRCTVFMNSSVKQAQREGAGQGDIAAGLSYSVVRNALYKVIKLKDAAQLGEKVVVQGGTFLNDAVLRAFELLTGTAVVRPDIAGLMGAYGAALTAQRNWTQENREAGFQAPSEPDDQLAAVGLDPDRAANGARSSALDLSELDGFEIATRLDTCRLCQNHCQLTISTFGDGSRHVSGNRCERGASTEKVPPKSELPNLFDYKYKRLFGYRRLTADKAFRGTIGIPRVLNMYENFPLWFTILTSLGFRVTISGRSSHEVFESGMESIPSENVCYPAKLAHGHLEHLLDKGIRTIFYPCVPLEAKAVEGADNHFNCPVVAFYPQVIEKNLPRLQQPDVTYLAPMLNLDDPAKLAQRLVEVFADWNVSLAEAQAAVEAGFAEDAKVKADIREEGRRALDYIAEHGIKGIVLAGRPYHVDPEVHHGIPSLINGLGMAVLTEDALVDAHEPVLARPIRVRDQWAYHTRLYEAAAQVTRQPDLHLVQLNSFGCGVDAITTDQVQEILEQADQAYTLLKIDEVSNLGAATIRLRSMKAAAAERRGSATVSTFGPLGERRLFDEHARDTHTVYAPQMAPIHFRLVIPVLRKLGLNVELLENASPDDVEVGLKYVNNDACFPAIMVVGQLVNKIRSGEADPDRTSVAITQTGGMCRATNYVSLLRWALADAGYPQVPVLAISVQGLEANPGFKLTPALMVPAIQALVLGDLLQTVLLRVRPYEAEAGSAKRLYDHWDAVCQEFLQYGGYSRTLGRSIGYTRLIKQIVRDFDALPLRDVPRKPRVGIVGEILVKFHPDANNHVVDVVEAEGCEAVLPGILQFFLMPLYSSQFQWETLGIGPRSHHVKRLAMWLIEKFQQPAASALRRAGKFDVPPTMAQLAAKADGIISLGTRAGESWLLTAEMVELIELGAPNIICAQPFACLPNHVVGKGMFAELRRRHPEANVVSVDYDPGASQTNQLNRIKLMVATAHKRHAAAPAKAAGDESAGDFALIDPAVEAVAARRPVRELSITPVSPVDTWDEVSSARL